MSATMPDLLIETTQNYLLISKKVLNKLGKPEFIQLLINPDTQKLAIHGPVDPKTTTGYIKVNIGKENNYLSIRSRHRVSPITRHISDLEPNHLYQVEGQFEPENHIFSFDLNTKKFMRGEIIFGTANTSN